MCRHMYNKVSDATPEPHGLELTVCGLFNHAAHGEVHGSVTRKDLSGDEPRAVCTLQGRISIQPVICHQEMVRNQERLPRKVWICDALWSLCIQRQPFQLC